ncbi:hypothetical protein BQ8482_180299 [Mesorhizobium delmotii]|uniref:Uncharacterized protein n=1 Tax=Mesorhizobium delmotii TaxID=1631247 RepID=A0A2P9AIX2_9HYPH|nr:hypothetical protein BQ8482_180299 [Mesorhizobium delmotii]
MAAVSITAAVSATLRIPLKGDCIARLLGSCRQYSRVGHRAATSNHIGAKAFRDGRHVPFVQALPDQSPARSITGMNGPVLLMTSMRAMFGPHPPLFFSIG